MDTLGNVDSTTSKMEDISKEDKQITPTTTETISKEKQHTELGQV